MQLDSYLEIFTTMYGWAVDFRAILTPVFHPILTPPFGV